MVTEAGSPIDIWKSVVQTKYSDFSGRARRAEYWWFAGVNLAIAVAGYIVALILGQIASALGLLVLVAVFLFYLAMLIPSIAVAIRRLHDTNKSGWFLLIGFIPLVGGFILLYFYVIDGDKGPNTYGPSPKYVA